VALIIVSIVGLSNSLWQCTYEW